MKSTRDIRFNILAHLLLIDFTPIGGTSSEGAKLPLNFDFSRKLKQKRAIDTKTKHA
jgi:hypothetical protein